MAGQLRFVANTGGDGVRRRETCDDRSGSPGWEERTAVTIVYTQRDCPDWVYVRRIENEPSWVRAGYLSAATPQPIRRSTGDAIESPRYSKGLGSLKVRNGTGRDAAAKLRGGEAPQPAVGFVYVRAGEEYTLGEIGPGTYVLQFRTGVDWDEENKVFRRDVAPYQFADPLDFRETPTESGTRYSTWEVSLNTVPGGTARTNDIDLSTFLKD